MRSERGMALIAAVLLLTLLFAVVLSVQETVGYERTNSKAAAADIEERLAFRSGVELARSMLLADDDATVDALNENWASEHEVTVNGLNVKVSIVDECGKLPLLVHASRRPGVPRRHVDFVAACLRNLEGLLKLDAGTVTRMTRRPLVMADMLSMPGVDEEEFYGDDETAGLMECTTLWTDGRININTAPRDVLRSLGREVTEEVAESIVELRADSPYSSVEELAAMSSTMGDLVGKTRDHLRVTSDCFSAEIVVRSGAGYRSGRAVLKRRGRLVEPVLLRLGSWTEAPQEEEEL